MSDAQDEPPLAAYGHPLKQEPKPGTIHALIAQRNYYRRALAAAVDGSAKIAWAADKCSRMQMSRPEEAIHYLRELHFHGYYRDVPLTQIEQDMVRQGSAFMTLLAYRVVVKSIERELVAAVGQTRRAPPAVSSNDPDPAAA